MGTKVLAAKLVTCATSSGDWCRVIRWGASFKSSSSCVTRVRSRYEFRTTTAHAHAQHQREKLKAKRSAACRIFREAKRHAIICKRAHTPPMLAQVLRVKNRFKNPTSGGWRDCMARESLPPSPGLGLGLGSFSSQGARLKGTRCFCDRFCCLRRHRLISGSQRPAEPRPMGTSANFSSCTGS